MEPRRVSGWGEMGIDDGSVGKGRNGNGRIRQANDGRVGKDMVGWKVWI